MLIGYARVSTQDQNLELQLEALKAAGCDRIFQDRLSGTKAHRPGLLEALAHLHAGDVLAVWKLDRLGRTVKGLVDLVEELERRGVHFRSMTDSIDTTTASGRFFFPRNGCSGPYGAGSDCGADQSRPERGSSPGKGRGAQTEDDTGEDGGGANTAGR